MKGRVRVQMKAVGAASHLAHNLTVDHSLVSGLYSGGVGQYGNVRIKFPCGLRM